MADSTFGVKLAVIHHLQYISTFSSKKKKKKEERDMISRGLLIKTQTLYSFVSFRGDKDKLNFSHGQSGVFPGGETTSFFPSVADDVI